MLKLTTAVAAAALVVSTIYAQAPPPQPPPAQAPPAAPAGGRGQGRVGAPQGFPAQQRPPGDPAVIAKGKTQYELVCAACHGRDLRGGDMGGPNLLRSLLGEARRWGDHLVKNGRPGRAADAAAAPRTTTSERRGVSTAWRLVAAAGMPPPSETAPELTFSSATRRPVE